MGWRENMTMIGLGGVSGLVVTVVYIGVTRAGVTPGEWLQFAAVFFGVAATMSGTMLLQAHSDRKRADKRVDSLLRSLRIPRELLQEIIAQPELGVAGRVGALERAMEHLKWAGAQLEAPDYRTYATLDVVIAVWERNREALAEQLQSAALYPSSALTPPVETASEILKWLESFKAIVEEEEGRGGSSRRKAASIGRDDQSGVADSETEPNAHA